MNTRKPQPTPSKAPNNPDIGIIGMPVGTRVYAIIRDDCRLCWRVWIAVNDMTRPECVWLGTYMRLDDCGRVSRVVVRPDEEDTFVIKET
jgi:hypothetical protein